MEAYITNTIELYSTNGVVHMTAVGLNPEEGYIHIEWDARALLNDLPSFYTFCKKAIKQEEEYQNKKFKDFKNEIAKDYKGKRVPTRE